MTSSSDAALDGPPPVAAHYDAIAGDYHLQYQREQLGSVDEYPANYFRLQILTTRLAALQAKRVYEVGVGEGTPLLTIARMGIEVAGCDVSEAMVDRAKARFEQAGLPGAAISWGDIQDSVTVAQDLRGGQFDAVIAAGVLPHVSNDDLFFENLRMLLKPGGSAFVEFRNKLFSLFTFNRNTRDFIIDDLLHDVAPGIRDVVRADLEQRLAIDEPRARIAVEQGAPGYDAILSRFHNPFELLERLERRGFGAHRLHWYHYHPAPPMLERQLGSEFREGGFALEHDPSDWRGYFLCSAGIVEAQTL